MTLFQVRYVAPDGAVVRTQLHAADAAQAMRALDVAPSAVLELAAAETSMRPDALRARPDAFPLAQFCDELATLLEAGLVLHEALQALHEREGHVLVARVVGTLLADLREGRNFADALRSQAAVFGPFLVAMIEASQRTGQVAISLRRHASHLRWQRQLRHKLMTAAAYPAMLSVAGAGVCLFLALVVVPRFAAIYDDLGGDVPLATRWLLAVSTSLTSHPWLLAVGLAALATGAVASWRRGLVTAALARAAARLPWFRRTARTIQLTTLYRTLGLLLQAGVPAMQAMTLSAQVVNAAVRPALEAATRRVDEGKRLSDALDAEGLCTAVSARMLRVGESSGNLGSMLERAAGFHDEELASISEWSAKVVGPVLMLAIGAVVGGIVLLMYMPIFDIAERIQ